MSRSAPGSRVLSHMKHTRLFIVLLTTCSAALATDKPLVTRNGVCAAVVPSDWSVGDIPSMGESADKKVSFVISNPKLTNSLEELKATVRQMYAEDKVTKDTASEFEMEGKGQSGKPNVYRAVISGKTICIGEVTYQSGAIDSARKIAETLRVK